MSQTTPRPLIRTLVTVTFIAMVIVNFLANALPINGQDTGAISDTYPNLFAPAGITFAIWGVIYLLLAAYTLFQLGLFQSRTGSRAGTITPLLLEQIGIPFIISSLANLAWIFTWHYFQIPLSLLLMLVILICLIRIAHVLRPLRLSPAETFFVRLPFSVYYGWITVAALANVTTLLVALKWNGWGISESTWTVIVLIVGALVGIIAQLRNRDIAYGLVLIWAYFGIWLKHSSSGGFAGRYPAVILTALACMGAFLITGAFTALFSRARHA